MNILGINAYHGDVSAALLRDGELVAAVEEERFTRVKHASGFPRNAVAACLSIGGVAPDDIEHVAVSRDFRTNRLRRVWFGLRHRPGLGLVTARLRNAGKVDRVEDRIADSLGVSPNRRLHWVEHHPAHLASAFFASPFEEAAVCSIDGFGDFVSTATAVGRGSEMKVGRRVYFPHSLGQLYLAITQYLGFWKFGDEYKVMGLAPYGEPAFVDRMRQLVHVAADGAFRLDLSYFRHWSEGVSMTWDDGAPVIGQAYTAKLEQLLGPPRRSEDPIQPRHEAIAASLQVVFEEVALHVLNALQKRTGLRRLCLAGGCAMNSVLNGKIRERTPFREVYVQPAAADNGTSLGAALHVWHQTLGQPRRFTMDHGYWGPEFSEGEVGQAVDLARTEIAQTGCTVRTIADPAELCRWTAERLARGRIVGWFQGRMEWGARALGNRSILADPRRADMREIINSKIKFREKFRPFAPSILEEALDEYFVGAVADPFMVQVYPVRPERRQTIPAVTHVDGSGRLQTVSQKTNPLYWQLLKAFEAETGVPVLLNTSFNENEPIVHHPREALECFLRTRMDALVVGHTTIEKMAP
jgi:carbamoyltransferase